MADDFGSIPDSEPEDALTVFNREWQAKLEEKKAAEVTAEATVKEKAAEELANWHKQRETKLTAKKETNRSEEAVVVEGLAADIEGAAPWERVMKLIDTNTEASDAKADVSRMKKLFIQLKNDKK
jgi:uncharacterized protein (UPF0548 family)